MLLALFFFCQRTSAGCALLILTERWADKGERTIQVSSAEHSPATDHRETEDGVFGPGNWLPVVSGIADRFLQLGTKDPGVRRFLAACGNATPEPPGIGLTVDDDRVPALSQLSGARGLLEPVPARLRNTHAVLPCRLVDRVGRPLDRVVEGTWEVVGGRVQIKAAGDGVSLWPAARLRALNSQ